MDLPESVQQLIMESENEGFWSGLPSSFKGSHLPESMSTTPHNNYAPSSSSNATKRGLSHSSPNNPKRPRNSMEALPTPPPSSNGSQNSWPVSTHFALNPPSSSSYGQQSVSQSPSQVVSEIPPPISQVSATMIPYYVTVMPIVYDIPGGETPSRRFYELNCKLRDRHAKNALWQWDSFLNNFFDDNVKFSWKLCLNNGESKLFTLSRPSIPGFFQSFFDGGAVNLFFNPPYVNEGKFQDNLYMLNDERCKTEVFYDDPVYTKNVSEGPLQLLFVVRGRTLRINSWYCEVRVNRDFFRRDGLWEPTYSLAQQMYISRQGFPQTALNYLESMGRKVTEEQPLVWYTTHRGHWTTYSIQ